MDFPDLPHLKQLQNDLWQWPKSRAAVMVGSGFSRNAEARPGVRGRFPTWQELARAIFDEINPPVPGEATDAAQERDQKFYSTNPLRIASQFDAVLKRPRLDDLVRNEIPDSQYVPGNLHHLLLELPWTDVFTTNYDTLLERTEVDGRTYYPVTKPSELTSAFTPRIIKLHGSLSQTPLILSEEDYRIYPQKFAPFVNTVQQSLVENAFVLLGFSGDDPNFFAWTGWIRDELGEDHAPIYLVGPLSLGNAERSLLDRRGVTAIDLAPVFSRAHIQNGIHFASIEWFLKSLSASLAARAGKVANARP